MRLSSSLEYLMNMPIKEMMGLIEEIIKADEETRRRRKR
jgi:hypothetical protein